MRKNTDVYSMEYNNFTDNANYNTHKNQQIDLL